MEDVGTSQRAPAPGRKWLFRPLAILLAHVTLVLLLEGVARVYAKLVGKERALVFDRELGWRPLPNLRKTGDFWGISRPARTNSRGWRDGEHAFERRAGVRRTVMLGDSFAFGLFVDDGDRLSDLIEQRVEGLEVVNMGVTAWGTDQQLRALEHEGFRYSPDFVLLLAFPHNDLEDIRKERSCSWPKPRFDLVDGELTLVKPVLTWDVRLRSTSFCAEFLYQRVRTRGTDERIAETWKSRDSLLLYAAVVRRMADQCKARGVGLVAVMAYPPDSIAKGPTDAERRARAALEEAGFATCDTLEAFRERMAAGEVLYAADALHWNARGNAVAAEVVQAFLSEHILKR